MTRSIECEYTQTSRMDRRFILPISICRHVRDFIRLFYSNLSADDIFPVYIDGPVGYWQAYSGNSYNLYDDTHSASGYPRKFRIFRRFFFDFQEIRVFHFAFRPELRYLRLSVLPALRLRLFAALGILR